MTRRAALGLVAALVIATAAPAQKRLPGQPERSPFLDGTHAFRRILYDVGGRARLRPLREQDLGTIDPKHTLIVVLGDPAPLNVLKGRLGDLESFVASGGALLVATDHRTPLMFGVRVNGDHVNLRDGGGVDAYRNIPECPLIEPQTGVGPPLFEPALAADRNDTARKVASNLPSFLEVPFQPSRLPVLGHLPRSSTHPEATFAAGGDFGAGRVLIMADQDVFINEMMLQKDDGNIDFAYRLADWLLTRPGERQKRDRILYYEDGTVQTDFDIPLKQLPAPPLPPPDTLMGMLDELLPAMEREGFFAQIEEENVANNAVEDLASSAQLWAGAEPEWKLWTLAAVLASVGLGLYGFVRLGTFRYRDDSAGPSLGELLRKQAPAGAVMAQRHEELLRDGNLWEAARDVARELFHSAGLSPDAAPLPPPIEVGGPWWRRWRTRLRWRQLWRLARSARPVRVSARGFARLAGCARALREGLADGTIRIIP